MKAYTDYPFVFLGDKPRQEAPIREVELLAYDENKYVMIRVEGQITAVKGCYLYEKAERLTMEHTPEKVDFEGKIGGADRYYELLDLEVE